MYDFDGESFAFTENLAGLEQDDGFDEKMDFHHQIAYRFEKVYRFERNGKPEQIIKAANNQILLMLSNQIWMLKVDPMILFYCLYFCVFYRNNFVY